MYMDFTKKVDKDIKVIPKGVTFPSGAIVRSQAKGWMDDNLMRDWIDTA